MKTSIINGSEVSRLSVAIHFYEICEGDEIYYNFTLVPTKEAIAAKFLLDDPWGGIKDRPLKEGIFKFKKTSIFFI